MATLVLALHLAIIVFNVLGLVVIPLGAWRGWRFVHAPVWRILHLTSWAVVAVQAIAGRACFLTDWQATLTGAPDGQPLVMRWVNRVIYWPLPMWVFTSIYVTLFVYAAALLWLVPFRSGNPS